MKKLFIFFYSALLIFNSAFLFGQAPGIEWQKCLGGTNNDRAFASQQTNDGGYIIVGQTASNDGDVTGNYGLTDGWVIKLNSLGNIQWQKCLGGTNTDLIHAIQQTTDGGFIIAGFTQSNDSLVMNNHGGLDYWVLKLDSSGIVQWQKCYGGSNTDFANFIQQTNDGGYIVAGSTESNDGDVSGYHDSLDFWILKIDWVGNIEWQKCLGGTANDYAYCIQQTVDGGFTIAGSSSSSNGDVNGNHGGGDYWIVKLDSMGILQWQKCFGGTDYDFAYSIRQTTDLGYIISGSSRSSDGDVTNNHGEQDYWIVKTDSVANIQWQKSLGGFNTDFGFNINQIPNGAFVVAGYTFSDSNNVSGYIGSGDFWLLKLDVSGNILWQKCTGGSNFDNAYCIEQTFDGGYITTGITHSNDGDVSGNHGLEDFWIIKLYPDTTTGIENLKFTNYDSKVFPNPAKDEITIAGYALQNNQPAVLKIYDVMGKEVLSQSPINRTSQIVNLKSFISGVYFVQVQTGAMVSRVKFIKQ